MPHRTTAFSTSPSVRHTVKSPVGPLTLVASDAGLQFLLFPNSRTPASLHLDTLKADPTHPVLQQTEHQLAEYFAGHRTTFDVPLDTTGTPFQQAVWALLQHIPYGQTTTYGALALKMGGPGKARAVGLANGQNPVSIIVPCHRVIGTSGALTGFGGGLPAKAYLLQLEQRRTHHAPTFCVQADLFSEAQG
ncbi:MAG: methylated-DNA--[protein]-cysteine S-methyltransferase [Rhodothermales bacterium]